jgi:hypothetical protein
MERIRIRTVEQFMEECRRRAASRANGSASYPVLLSDSMREVLEEMFFEINIMEFRMDVSERRAIQLETELRSASDRIDDVTRERDQIESVLETYEFNQRME